MDSIDACGRMHDLILHNRVAHYRPDMLSTALYDKRTVVECHFPTLGVVSSRDAGVVRGHQAERARADSKYLAYRDGSEERAAKALLSRIRKEGPKTARELGDGATTTSAWGSRQSVVANLLDKLYHHGDLTIVGRESFQRRYGLAPASDLGEVGGSVEAAAAHLRARARRLFRVTPNDMKALSSAAFQPIRNARLPAGYAVLTEDADTLARAEGLTVPRRALLLAPLDPLIYDRARTKAIFDFDYRWEVYTPKHKRHWGYYALPVLFGDRLVATVDATTKSRVGVLVVHSILVDGLAAPSRAFAAALVRCLRDFASFSQANRIDVRSVRPRAFLGVLKAAGLGV